MILGASDGTNVSRLQIAPSKKISDFSEDLITEDTVDPQYLRLIAAIGFVADSDEDGLSRHLVLNRDSQRYEQARSTGNQELMKKLE